MGSFSCGEGFSLIEVLQLSLLGFCEEFGDEFSSVLEVFQSSLFLFVGVLALGLEVEQCLIQGPVILIQRIMVIPFLEQPLPLSFEILLRDLTLLLLNPLLPLKMFLSDIRILLEPTLVILLGGLDLILDVLLPAPSQSLQLAVNLLFF